MRRTDRAREALAKELARGPAGSWQSVMTSPEERATHGQTDPLSNGGFFRDECFRNNHHSVQVSDEPSAWGSILHLWIRRHDGEPIRSWAALQRIKRELGYHDRTAVEVFPADDVLVDHANMYHLWLLPEGMQLPFGLHRVEGQEP